ncbi:MAG: glycosyltransferase [Acuticoccus sp.]
MPRRVLILTYGSRGDVEPFIALAGGLRARGHTVFLATSERFRALVEGHNVPFIAMSDASLAAIESPDGKAMLEGGRGPLRRLAAGARLARRAGPINDALMRQSLAAADAASPDLIVFNIKLFAAPHIAEKRGIPAVLAALQPMVVPTRAFPAMGLPRLAVPGTNLLSYRLVHASIGAYRSAVNRFRLGCLGLPPVRHRRAVLFPPGAGTIPVLHAHSRHVLPPPDDWPSHAHVTGYWRLRSSAADALPQELVDFLAAGPPPVYVGFGSMTSADPARLGRLITGALRRAGQRGVVARGWANLEVDAGADIIAIPPVPHDVLFPKMAAVVHHGGAGTTAAGFHAGVPSVICPFFGDQPGWARLSAALGVGTKPMTRRQLSEEALGAAIAEAVSSPALAANARTLAARLHAEDGVADAVRLLANVAAP